jgi:hypothetical protein
MEKVVNGGKILDNKRKKMVLFFSAKWPANFGEK